MCLPQGCSRLLGEIVRLNKSSYDLKQVACAPHYAVVDFRFLQCLGDACVLPLMEQDIVVMTIAVHIDDTFSVGEKARCDQLGRD